MKQLMLIVMIVMPNYLLADNKRMDFCRKIANLENKNMPATVDSLTTALNMNCKYNGNRVVAVYTYQGGLDKSNYKIDNRVINIKKNMLCSNPVTRKLLNIVDIEHENYDVNYEYIGSITVTRKDCLKQ